MEQLKEYSALVTYLTHQPPTFEAEEVNEVSNFLSVVDNQCSEVIAATGLLGLIKEPSLQCDYVSTRDMIWDFGCYILQKTLTNEKLIQEFRKKVHYKDTLTRNCIQCCDVWTEYFKSNDLRTLWNEQDMSPLTEQSLLKLNNETKKIIEVIQDDVISEEILSFVFCIIENVKKGLTTIPSAQSNEVGEIPAIAIPKEGNGFTWLRNKLLRPLLEKVKMLMKESFDDWYNLRIEET